MSISKKDYRQDWAKATGHSRLLDSLPPDTEMVDASIEHWIANVKNVVSPIQFRCTVCLHESRSCIKRIVKGVKPNCNCAKGTNRSRGGTFRWNSNVGFETMRGILSEKSSDLLCDLAEWTSSVKDANSFIRTRCQICKVELLRAISGICSQKLGKCKCSGHLELKYDIQKVLEKVANTRFEFVDPPDNIQSRAVIDFRCKVCGDVVASTYSQLVHQGSVGCSCNNPDEALVVSMLRGIVHSNCTVGSQTAYPNIVGVNGGGLRADASIFIDGRLLALFEVDGGYHFKEYAYNSRSASYDSAVKHDLKKEEWCISNSIPMFRVSQRLVATDAPVVELWLRSQYERLLLGTVSGIHRLSHTRCYVDSVYSRKRIGTLLEVKDEPIDLHPGSTTGMTPRLRIHLSREEIAPSDDEFWF